MKIDPDIPVADTQKAIADWLDTQPMSDIYVLLRPLKENTPSTAPRPLLLAEFGALFSKLAQVCANAKLPPVKTEAALRAIHAQAEIFFTPPQDNKTVEDCAEEVGKLIRIAFMKYREVLTNPDTKRIVFSKALNA